MLVRDLVVLALAISATSSELVVDIVVKSTDTHNECSSTCLTLSEFSKEASQLNITDGATLTLHPGDHSLESGLNFQNMKSFSMHALTKEVRVICSGAGGFSFINVSQVRLINISIIGCGGQYVNETRSSVLNLLQVGRTEISGCHFISSKGKVVCARDSSIVVLGSSTILSSSCDKGVTWFEKSHVIIFNTSFVNNRAENVGILYVFDNSVLAAENCTFLNNTVKRVGILQIQLRTKARLSNVTLMGNRCYVGIVYVYESSVESEGELRILNNVAKLSTTYIVRSDVHFKGRQMFSHNRGTCLITNSNVKFSGYTKFSHNRAKIRGGAITMLQSTVYINSSALFSNNSAMFGGAISVYDSVIHVSRNHVLWVMSNAAKKSGGGVHLFQSEMICQGWCNISKNIARESGGGMCAFGSSIIVGSKLWSKIQLKSMAFNNYSGAGSLIFSGNQAKMGGGISLAAYSKIYGIGENHLIYKILFTRNVAKIYGGAIFVNDSSNPDVCDSKFHKHLSTSNYECFLQTLYYTPAEGIQFADNFASEGGSILHGGLLDRCDISPFSHIHEDRYLISGISSDSKTPSNGLKYFKNVTGITDLDTISSSAVRVCLCKDDQFNCSRKPLINVKRGEAFNVSLIAIDQVKKPQNATIRAYVKRAQGYIDGRQNERNITSICTNLTFNVYSEPVNEYSSLILYALGPCSSKGVSKSEVRVKFKKCTCPVGFQPTEESESRCDCECHRDIRKFTTKCNSTTQSIFRDRNFWIQFVNRSNITGYVTYSTCPFDYCQHPSPGRWINLDTPDEQCASHRTGVLCGMCQQGYSLSVSSSRCITCHRWYQVYAALQIVGMVMAGIALVVVMLVLNLTVAVGTLNGILFYVNLVGTNFTLFLPFETPNIFTLFIAWLNMAVGIDMCLYKGMDMYFKTWLLFVFPVYIISLLLFIPLLSRCSPKFARFIGKSNPVATLATLLLFSYTNILRANITIFSFTILKYPDDSSDVVWLRDANVKYFQGKHLPLFMVGTVTLVLNLGYTFLLFAWQWLIKLPKTRLTGWTRSTKLNAFLYTYHVAHTSRHRYWTGLLLLARIVLYLISYIHKDTHIRLLSISLTAITLLLIKALFRERVYRNKFVDCLNTVSILNLLLLSLVALCIAGGKNRQKQQEIIAYISVSIAMMTFIVILVYHLKITLMEIAIIRTLFKRARLSTGRLNNNSNGSDDATEMISKAKVTSSEVKLSPSHDSGSGSNRLSGTCRDSDVAVFSKGEDNNLREPLLV